MKLIHKLLCFALIGCHPEEKIPTNEVNKENSIHAVQAKAANQIRNKFGLIPCGTGAGAMHDVKMLALSFFCYEPVDQELGRAMLILCVDEFLKTINSNQEIQPFLSNKPFLPKNIEIAIFIQKKDGSEFDDNSLSIISSTDGYFKYKITNSKTEKLETIHKETYEEALAKIKTESFLSKSPSPKQNETPEKSDPVTSVTQRAEKNISIKTGLIQ